VSVRCAACQGLTKDGDEYETKIAHVELAKKMRKRDPATAPAVGDRVPYVIIKVGRRSAAGRPAAHACVPPAGRPLPARLHARPPSQLGGEWPTVPP
jgi:hypothetical protein